MIPKFLIRLAFYPSLAFNRLMCAMGIWRTWDAVDEHVIVGSLPRRKHLKRLYDLGVRAVVNLCGEYVGDTKALREFGMEQLHLATLDFYPPSEEDLHKGVAFSNKKR